LSQKLRVVPGEGFEPPTFGLQNRCTTTVLTRQAADINHLSATRSTDPENSVPFSYASNAVSHIPCPL
jgi:hypothetical protein